MRRRFSTLLRPFALLAAVTAAAFASTPAAAAGVEDVLKEIAQQGQARVLVRMKADGGGAVAWSPRLSVSRQRVAVATALNETAPVLARARVVGVRGFRTIPYLAATLTREQAMALASDDSVEGIYLIQRERRVEATAVTTQALNLTAPQQAIDLGSAWSRGFDGAGTSIAVIDSGININHPALAGKNVGDACFSDTYGVSTSVGQCPSGQKQQVGFGAASNCPEGGTQCDHGTHVASVAVGNDGTAFGVARGAKLVPINVFVLETDSSVCNPDATPCMLTDSLAVLNALDYVNEHALELNIAAVNLSVGGSTRDGYCDDDPRKSVIDMLRQKGVAVAVAASNGGQTGKITTPACISSAVGVGSTDNGTAVASFSNFANTLDFVAPGVSISGAKGSGSGYGTRSGTSMSAPQVAGAFAVLRQAFPTLAVDNIETVLKETGTSVTRADSGATVAKIQVSAALDRLQGVNRRLFNNVLASVTPQGESLLRFYNPTAAVGNVRATLRDAGGGEYLGEWISPPIAPHAALQFTAQGIVANASKSGLPVVIGPRAYVNLEIAGSFKGSAQHLFWSQHDGVLTNLTNCGTAVPTDDAKQLMNVHSSSFGEFPSRIRIVNTGAAPTAAKLRFYNAGTGAEVMEWTSPEIASGASNEVMMRYIEATSNLPEDALAGSNGYYNVTVEGFSGYLQHLVENLQPGSLQDMTAKCDIVISATPQIAAP